MPPGIPAIELVPKPKFEPGNWRSRTTATSGRAHCASSPAPQRPPLDAKGVQGCLILSDEEKDAIIIRSVRP